MLTKVDKRWMVLWLVPLAIGGAAALNAVGDEQMVIVFITRLTTVSYIAIVISMFYPGHGYIDTPRARGRSVVIDQAWTLLFVILVVVYIAIAHGQWTIAVLALEITTIITIAAYANERETELDPAK